MSQQNRKRQHSSNEDDNDSLFGFEAGQGSMDTIGDGNTNTSVIDEMKLKIAALEVWKNNNSCW
jgi:hypothetical protein